MGGTFLDAYRGRRVLVTGHTGFKGTWLCSWLLELGAYVHGFALDPPTDPNAFELCGLAGRIVHSTGDVRDAEKVRGAVESSRPEFLFHLAAQPIVRRSYADPLETLGTNVMGTANVLEAIRRVERPCIVVVVTSDKCYVETREATRYAEDDRLGGRDPYSASKACAELVVESFRQSFFPVDRHDEHRVSLASVRAGNVFGGGDWATDRLVPDIFRALYEGRPVGVRNPDAVRPWQHVLDALSGYLWLGARMHSEGPRGLAEAWNFGPAEADTVSVRGLVELILGAWGEGRWVSLQENRPPHEARHLGLSCEKARRRLRWRPAYDLRAAVEATAAWYRRARSGGDMYEFTVDQIRQFARKGRGAGVEWAGTKEGAAAS